MLTLYSCEFNPFYRKQIDINKHSFKNISIYFEYLVQSNLFQIKLLVCINTCTIDLFVAFIKSIITHFEVNYYYNNSIWINLIKVQEHQMEVHRFQILLRGYHHYVMYYIEHLLFLIPNHQYH